MAKLYFLNREFEGASMCLDEILADKCDKSLPLLFYDSWYWLHYRFFNSRDAFACDTSTVVRTHLYNFAAALYQQFEGVCKKNCLSEVDLQTKIDELVKIAEHSRTFPISYWTYGDEVSRSRLEERFSGLPSAQQIERLLEIPCFIRMQHERMPYCYDNEVAAEIRFRKEEEAFKKKRASLDDSSLGEKPI